MSEKIVKDEISNARGIVEECSEIIEVVFEMYGYVIPDTRKVVKQYGAIARYITTVRPKLQKGLGTFKNFKAWYPGISSVIGEGKASNESNPRLADGLYKVSQLRTVLEECQFLLKTDKQRGDVQAIMRSVIADFCIFLITQFNLSQGDGSVMLSIKEMCADKGVSVDVFYGHLLDIMEACGIQPYGYETISPYYDELMGVDPVFLTECEDAGFPLTADISAKIVEGTLPIEEARGLLIDYQRQVETKELKGVNALNMVSRLNLS